MGTRNLICVWWKGKWYIAQYHQWNGFPEGTGLALYRFLAFAGNVERLKHGLDKHIYYPTEEEVDAIHAECQAWDEARWERARQGLEDPGEIDWNRTGYSELYPSMWRSTGARVFDLIIRACRCDGSKEEGEQEEEVGGDIDDNNHHARMLRTSTAYILSKAKLPEKLPIRMELEFVNATLSCEWAYVVDLDREVLEMYCGGPNARKKHDVEGHRFKDVGPPSATVPDLVCDWSFGELQLLESDKEFMDKVKAVWKKRMAERKKEEWVYEEHGWADY